MSLKPISHLLSAIRSRYGRQPVTERRATATGLPLSQLEAVLRSLPALSEAEAADFAADLDAARSEMRRYEA
jgi:hypothetical protein